mmetsp:Transcript_6303/g.5418  ORF Transcript_6303/g.5418 Transcript_6303/m.5418 type:complete len:287 (+) Transcript_6303:1-861(+)
MKGKEVRKRGKTNKGKSKNLTNTRKISSGSRTVKKTNNSKNSSNRRAPKRSDKAKKYSLGALNGYFEDKFNVDVDSELSLSLAQKKFRNKYLFSTIKESGQVYNNSDILFDEGDALIYLQMLSRTLDKSDDYYMEEVPFIEIPKKEFNLNVSKNSKIMVKKTSNLSTISEANSGNEELKHQESEDERYNDPYEQEYLEKLRADSKSSNKKRQVKWLGKALDLFRTVENHKKSGVFYKPYIASDIDTLDKNLKINSGVSYPITLKTVGVQLSLGLYKKYEDFKHDMM